MRLWENGEELTEARAVIRSEMEKMLSIRGSLDQQIRASCEGDYDWGQFSAEDAIWVMGYWPQTGEITSF